MNEVRFPFVRPVARECEAESRHKSDALNRSAIRQRVEERRQAQDANMLVVVQMLLRAAFPKGSLAYDRTTAIRP
jgi:hypothetical protein